jgi:arginyl-tRNA synthetase
VVKAGVAALGHPQDAEGSHHLAYEKVVLSPATARALGYAVADDENAVKVSGRKGLGVKADDLLEALLAKARAEVDARDPSRDAAAREATAAAVAQGALRYFMLRFGRTRIITFDMEEALAFTGETGPYVQNAVVRARNILGKLEAEGHHVETLLARACALDLTVFLTGEEGDLVWSLLLLMARSDEVAEQAIRAQEVALVLPEAPALGAVRRERRAPGLPHAGRPLLRASDGVAPGAARDPDPGADVRTLTSGSRACRGRGGLSRSDTGC